MTNKFFDIAPFSSEDEFFTMLHVLDSFPCEGSEVQQYAPKVYAILTKTDARFEQYIKQDV
jgi:hypothetical protein